jgi:hypothetical protein
MSIDRIKVAYIALTIAHLKIFLFNTLLKREKNDADPHRKEYEKHMNWWYTNRFTKLGKQD